LDCTEVIGGRTAAELEGEVTDSPKCYVGKLPAKIVKEVRSIAGKSRLLSPRDKKLIDEQWPAG
jgi:hypothetical protein